MSWRRLRNSVEWLSSSRSDRYSCECKRKPVSHTSTSELRAESELVTGEAASELVTGEGESGDRVSDSNASELHLRAALS